MRRGLLAIAVLACALTLAPATSSAADTDLRTRLTDSLRSPALSLGPHRGDRARRAHRRGALRPQRVPSGRARVEREGSGLVGGAHAARARLPLPHGGPRRRHARRLHLARRPVPQGTRRPDPPGAGRRAACRRRAPGRDHPRDGMDPRRRVGLRQSARCSGMEAVVRRDRDAAPVGARRRARPGMGSAEDAASRRRPAPPHRARRPGRPGRRAGRARDRAGRRRDARSRPLGRTAAPSSAR